MQVQMVKVLGWCGVAAALSISTFGFSLCISGLACLLAFLAGILSMGYVTQRPAAEFKKHLFFTSLLPPPPRGLPKVMKELDKPAALAKKDRRLTGASIIDEQLHEVINLAFRDFIQSWYFQISTEEEFLVLVRSTVQKVVVILASKVKEVDWVPYLTGRLVNDFAHHLHLYRQAHAKLKILKDADPNSAITHQTLFFDLERSGTADICREQICTSPEDEKEYLQDLTEILLYLLLPPEDFSNKLLQYLVREIMVNMALAPTIALLSSPDYLNQLLVWLCREAPLTSDGFLLVIKCSDNPEELAAVREIVVHEIAVQRSRDTGGDDDAEIKQQLSSLQYVLKVVDLRLQRLQEGGTGETDSAGLPVEMDWQHYSESGLPLVNLSFDMVLTDNIGLYYFTEFMKTIGAQGCLYLYHAIEGYKVSAEQLISQKHLAQVDSNAAIPDMETLREAASHIYNLYLSQTASLCVPLEEKLVRKIAQQLREENPSELWFDEVQSRVYEKMQEEPYFPAFKKSKNYLKLLEDLDLLKDLSSKGEDDSASSISVSQKDGSVGSAKFLGIPDDNLSLSGYDSISLSSSEHEEDQADNLSIASGEAADEECSFKASIYNTGVSTHSGKQFAVYAIAVTRKDPQGMETSWSIIRRYSDFHNLYVNLGDKYLEVKALPFPGKKAFNNLNREFLHKRSVQLNEFLQQVLAPDLLAACPGLLSVLLRFLNSKHYAREKRQLVRVMSNMMVNPIKSSVRGVGFLMKAAVPDGLIKALGNSRLPPPLPPSAPLKKSSIPDIEGEDNIPLRILLLLMDEVFDLRSKDQWFRRRIIILLRQIIKATFGDTINRRIVDYVEMMTSATQVAEYVKKFRNSFWPNGTLAPPSKERDLNTQMRTRVAAKMLMLCSIPDELKHLTGSSTTRRGVLCVFEMFQHPVLNRRLVYVLLEGVLETLFPSNHFAELFRRLHQRHLPPVLDFEQLR